VPAPSLAYDIEAISPAASFGAPAVADAPVREALRRYEPILHQFETDEYNLRRFRSAAFHFIPLLLGLPIDLRGATMLEIGCGRGLKGLATWWSTTSASTWLRAKSNWGG
jgi:hypothetical protein